MEDTKETDIAKFQLNAVCKSEAKCSCRTQTDGLHCDCWFDGDACCACGAIPMTVDERIEQGMEL
jgi:hypothetical protein